MLDFLLKPFLFSQRRKGAKGIWQSTFDFSRIITGTLVPFSLRIALAPAKVAELIRINSKILYPTGLCHMTYLVSIFALLLASCGSEPTPPPPMEEKVYENISKEEKAMLRDGDIILRRGEGMVSDFIAEFLEEKYPFTHCALLSIEGGKYYVTHSESNPEVSGMLKQPLMDFVINAIPGTLGAVRLKATPTQIKAIQTGAAAYLKAGKPFDLKFNLTDTTEFYCVEMLDHLFQRALKKNVLSRKKNLVAYPVYHMDNFLDPQHFTVLFNHFER